MGNQNALLSELRRANSLLSLTAHDNRGASKASLIGGSQPEYDEMPDLGEIWEGSRKNAVQKAIKATLGGSYKPGSLFASIMDCGERDIDLQLRGRQGLATLGIHRVDGPGLGFAGKATLGATGATGGYVLANNLVDTVVKPKAQEAFWPRLFKQRNGVSVRGVDTPYRTTAAQRATFIDWGQTKTNVNESYGTYSAVLGTLALIYDIGKQYMRFSAGAAENDVMDEITKGMALAENYACAVGPGTGTIGTGDPTCGVYTSLIISNPAFTTTFTPVGTTLLGSFAEGLTKAFQAMAARSRTPTAVVVDATTFWTALGQGTDTAGFWASPLGGPTGFSQTTSGEVRFWGVPVMFDANLTNNGVPAKAAICVDGDAFTFYRGAEFRIDSTDVGGTRWDQNLVGFRGEEEIAIHAGAGVATGGAQLLLNAIP